MQSIVSRLTAIFFLVRAVGKGGFLSIKSGIFFHKKWNFSGILVELCGIFRPQRKTCLTFAASTTNNVSRGDASV